MMSVPRQVIPQAVWEWLANLHTATAGRSTPGEAADRIELVAPMIASRFPSEAFNKVSFEHVAAQCRFWPAYGELVALLGEWWRENRAGRSLLIPYAGPSHIPAGRGPPDEAEKAAVRAMVGDLVAELRASAAGREGPPPPPLRDVTLQGEALARARAARGLAAAVVPAAEQCSQREPSGFAAAATDTIQTIETE